MPESVPANVSGMFEAMIPGGLVFLIFLLVRYGLSFTSWGTAQQMIYKLLQASLMNVGGGLFGCIVYLVMIKILWWLGIHGGAVVAAAMYPITATASAANLAAFAAGTAAPYPEWSITTLICPGIGLLALNLLMLIRSKSKQYKSIGKIAIPTSLFNITEPMMFGTPIVMNPIFLIPFIASPVISLFATLGVMKIGLVAMPTGATVNNFIPLPILGSLVNAHWTGFVWTCILIVLNMALYYPFFLIADKKALQDEKNNEEQSETEKIEEA
jgi:PTS system cellobiose-specific IIC component